MLMGGSGMKDGKRDIWTEGIKCIMGSSKKSLLDFIDALSKKNVSSDIRNNFGLIKGRVHNDISQATLSLGILMENLKVKGNIKAFIGTDNEEDPWVKEARNIIDYAKTSLLDFIKAISAKDSDDFNLIAKKIEADLNRSMSNICVLFSTFANGGDISTFEGNIRRKDDIGKKRNYDKRVMNTVIK